MTCVLIADTDPSARIALTVLLTRKYAAQQILYADDLQSLTAKVRAGENCIILISDQLPGLVFPVTCEQIRKINPQARLVILSVDPMVEEQADYCGAAFIHKGESITISIKRLEQALSGMDCFPN